MLPKGNSNFKRITGNSTNKPSLSFMFPSLNIRSSISVTPYSRVPVIPRRKCHLSSFRPISHCLSTVITPIPTGGDGTHRNKYRYSAVFLCERKPFKHHVIDDRPIVVRSLKGNALTPSSRTISIPTRQRRRWCLSIRFSHTFFQHNDGSKLRTFHFRPSTDIVSAARSWFSYFCFCFSFAFQDSPSQRQASGQDIRCYRASSGKFSSHSSFTHLFLSFLKM